MNKIRTAVLIFAMCLLNIIAFAQSMNNQTEDSTDFMRSEGKLYVVMAVVITIVLGIFIYLVNLDKKISKLEKK
ncbi:MAG TPA: CcmD family protein [Panacibacter sp.]|nr:CcmD family protein [Panacibacter sp.]HNP45666.1 CcmD family protein [Panacibacter sp.]